MRKSPKNDTPCLYCGKLFAAKGVYEHERHSCVHNRHRKKRSFGKVRCKICGKVYHQNGLRAHMATQHPLEFAQENANRKPSSRAAKRRELAKRQSSAHSGKRAAATERTQGKPPPKQKPAHPHHKSKEKTEPVEPKQPRKTPWSDPRHPDNRKANRRRDASRDAWAEMGREISRAAATMPGNVRTKEL